MSIASKISRNEDPAAIQRAMSSKPDKTPSTPNSQTARKINNLANIRLPKAYVNPSIQKWLEFQSSHDLIKASYLTLEPSLESSTKLKLKLNPKKHEMHDAESK